MNIIMQTFVGLKCLIETKIQILCDHVDHTRFHIVEMGCQMVQLLSAHIAGPTMCVNLTSALCIFLKPGLRISCKNRKHMFADTFLLSFLRMSWSSHSCNDRRYSYFTRNICNGYADCFKTLFRT